MSYKKIVKGLEKLAEKHGAKDLQDAVCKVYGVEIFTTLGDPPTAPPGGCGNGYIWSQTLGRCIPYPG